MAYELKPKVESDGVSIHPGSPNSRMLPVAAAYIPTAPDVVSPGLLAFCSRNDGRILHLSHRRPGAALPGRHRSCWMPFIQHACRPSIGA